MVRPAGMGPTMSVCTASLAATVTKDARAGTPYVSDDYARYPGESLDERHGGIASGDLLPKVLFRVGRHHPAEDHEIDRGHVEQVHNVIQRW